METKMEPIYQGFDWISLCDEWIRQVVQTAILAAETKTARALCRWRRALALGQWRTTRKLQQSKPDMWIRGDTRMIIEKGYPCDKRVLETEHEKIYRGKQVGILPVLIGNTGVITDLCIKNLKIL